MAVSTSFAGAKLEALLSLSSSSAATTSSRASTGYSLMGSVRPIRTRRLQIQGGVRCEVAASSDASTAVVHRFLLYNNDAIQHLFEVSAGLDSLVLGEGQILAQVKQVVKVGQGVVGFGRNISGLFKHAITVGKWVRTETNIAAGAVSVNSAAVELALMKLPASPHATARMLVIGASKMGKLVIKHLVAKGCTKMVVVNRTEERVASIRDELHTPHLKPHYFSKEDVKDLPAVGPETGGLRLFVDIFVPQNVSSCVTDVVVLNFTMLMTLRGLWLLTKRIVCGKQWKLRKLSLKSQNKLKLGGILWRRL
ncbi:hypothetical protein ACFX19_040998 [Malus domestica]